MFNPAPPSLFGNTTPSAGSPNATTQPQSNSLFSQAGQQNTSSQPQSGSLFGSVNQTTSQPQSNSLFSRIGQPNVSTQAPSGSLFGGANSTAQPSSTSLFGGANQPTQPSGGSLFNSTAQNSQPMAGSLFASTTQAPTAQLASTQSTLQDGQIVHANNAPQAAVFEDLLARGKKRREVPGSSLQGGALPSLQLGLGDISSKIKGLGSTKPDFSQSRANDSRAQYLLAASGVPQGATHRDLEDFAAETAAASTQIPQEFDPRIDSFVANIHAKTTRELMEEAMQKSKQDFDIFLEDNLQIDWDYQRQRVYEHLGLVKPSDNEYRNGSSVNPATHGSFGRSSRRSRGMDATSRGTLRGSLGATGMGKSVLGGSIARGSIRQNMFKDVTEKAGENGIQSAVEDPFRRTKQERYMTKVKELNVSRIEEAVYPVIEQFARVELEGGSDTPQHLIASYHALRSITKENSNAERPSDAGALRERQYAADYLGETPQAASNIRIRQQILQGSLKYLEDNFFARVEEAVERNPQEANIGGMPTKASKVRGYLRIREAARDLLAEDQEPQRGEDGEPIWAMIFFLIRCGLVTEAAQYVADNERVVKTFDRSFPQYVAAYASQQRDIPYALRSRMAREYQQRQNNPGKVNDPYRMACYKVMGRCDLGRQKLDIPSPQMEDLIWLYFSLARESNRAEETAGETFGLEEVQNIITDIKERHFTPSNDEESRYATCFYLQILAGMFEEAIAWLYPHDYVTSVHFAIALDFYGLLRVQEISTTANELCKHSSTDSPKKFTDDPLSNVYDTRKAPDQLWLYAWILHT